MYMLTTTVSLPATHSNNYISSSVKRKRKDKRNRSSLVHPIIKGLMQIYHKAAHHDKQTTKGEADASTFKIAPQVLEQMQGCPYNIVRSLT